MSYKYFITNESKREFTPLEVTGDKVNILTGLCFVTSIESLIEKFDPVQIIEVDNMYDPTTKKTIYTKGEKD